MGIPQHPFSELRSWTHLPSPPWLFPGPPWPCIGAPRKSLDCLTPCGYLLPRRPSLSLSELICERRTYDAQVCVRWYSYCGCYHSAFLLPAFCRGNRALPSFLTLFSLFCKHISRSSQVSSSKLHAPFTDLIHGPCLHRAHCPARRTERKQTFQYRVVRA